MCVKSSISETVEKLFDLNSIWKSLVKDFSILKETKQSKEKSLKITHRWNSPSSIKDLQTYMEKKLTKVNENEYNIEEKPIPINDDDENIGRYLLYYFLLKPNYLFL